MNAVDAQGSAHFSDYPAGNRVKDFVVRESPKRYHEIMKRVGNSSLAIVLASVALAFGPPTVAQTIDIDNADPEFTILAGTWGTGAYGSPYGDNYNWAQTTTGSFAQAEWRPNLPQAGEYRVSIHYVPGANRADDSPFTVHHTTGSETIRVNQQLDQGYWYKLGDYYFDAGTSGFVTLTNDANPSYVIADAVRFRSMEGIVDPDHADIQIGGSLFHAMENGSMRLDRIDPQLFADAGDLFSPSVAVLTSGVTIRFRTDSPTIRANFTHVSYVVTENTGYVIYQDGQFDQIINELATVDIVSNQPGTPVTFEIVCPSYDEVIFDGLELEPGSSLYPLPPDNRPRYFAFGDSITHGAEIDADTKGDSTVGYAWQVAAARGWQLFNVAVGGSKVTPAFGTMLDGQRADVITILWGLNDKSRVNDLPLYITKYEAFLDNLRAAQPYTPIYCITMTTCSGEGAGSNGYTLDDYRNAIVGIVTARQAAGDCHIHLIHGEDYSLVSDTSDGVHFSVPGAARFATQLSPLIDPPWGDTNDDGAWTADDWNLLSFCLEGPGIVSQLGICEGLDYDCDQDIDLQELAVLQTLVNQ